MSRARLIKPNELRGLLSLYEYLNPDDPQLVFDSKLEEHWNAILADPNLYYIVIAENGMPVSTCNITIINNLTRAARAYGLIENVVTHPDCRQKGYGKAVLKKAIEIAKEHNCYKIMLMTGRKEESVLRFYEKAGFNSEEKTAFIMRM
jgi:GNAT superfamily N-acetyltransferase